VALHRSGNGRNPLKTFGAGVVELVDARDSKSVRRGFGKALMEAESPFFMLFSSVQRLILKYVYIWVFIPLIDTYMDTYL
jgi:hypothetical protein